MTPGSNPGTPTRFNTMSSTFTKKIEDFTCENCGTVVYGNGFTNHCSNCLWSKHVDVNPGDRACLCEGLMEPIESILKKQEYFVKQKCLKCGFFRVNSLGKNDNFSVLLNL